MKYFYDTEFYEDGERIHLLSIGIIADDGRELYFENANFDWSIVPEQHFVRTHVRPWLYMDNHRYTATKNNIRDGVADFITQTEDNELWAYYAAYDHVALAQLFGVMVDMPLGIPWYTNDLKQEAVRLGFDTKTVIQADVVHHALGDARWNKMLYEAMKEAE
jgi:hypothetical protein